MGDLALVALSLALALWMALAFPTVRGRLGAAIFALVGLALLLARFVPIGHWGFSLLFYIFAALTLLAAVCAVSFRHPIYCAVWFGVMFLGTSGLLLLAGAQFLAAATLIVYAGAILVIFLFVLMLAQPEGRAAYDLAINRPLVVALLGMALASLVVGVAVALMGSGDLAELSAAGDRTQGVLQPGHVAAIARTLFSRHVIALEVVGVILLVALVGAAMIVGRAEGFLLGPPRQTVSRAQSGQTSPQVEAPSSAIAQVAGESAS
ncbi:MAG: NADH-quinone oxidoreductase subunit J [Thermoguttaceae bacterium]|nr:NADH-quinone oxidoreductase subunit J [Thermoguttaceae bacterium]MDW8079608.1 NADH-quinone oxidoreductase subunit J [Thermoguttaceae bacterium]